MSLKLITAPASEPITLADAKLHLRVDTGVTADDTLITALIVAARQGAEHITGRALMPQTWELALDSFDEQNSATSAHSYRITLPKPPFVSITSITYLDESGVLQTMAADAYLLDTHSEPARIMPAYGTCWPATRNQANAVLIRYVAGYADAASVPQQIKNWMLLRIEMLYANRGSVVTGISIAEVPYVDRLLDRDTVWGV
jgi:uncharacterized phiE125 gp8 family phage protein